MKIQYKCEVCGLTFDKLNVLGTHIKRHHKIEVKDYYDIYLKTDINEGICCNKTAIMFVDLIHYQLDMLNIVH